MARHRAAPISTAPRRAPRQERSRTTRDVILLAAARVLEREGAERLTTNRVAEVAGVSIGTLYQYFPNKQALIAALFERNTGAMGEVVRRVLREHPGGSPELVALAVARGITTTFAGQDKIHLALYEHAAALGLTRTFEAMLAVIVDELAAWLGAHPAFALPEPRGAAWVIVHAVDGVLRGHALGVDTIDAAVVVRETAAMLLRYLPRAAPPAAPPPAP